MKEKDASGIVKATTGFTIGSYGLVTVKNDPNGHQTLYGYDANGYLGLVTTPLGNQTSWQHDALGFVTSRLDAMNRTTTYTPDAWERLVNTTYADGSTHWYTYDANSNLTLWGDPVTGAWFRTYDADNRVLTEGDNSTTLLAHSYDAAGQKGLLSTTTDYFGRVISYAYTARNELAAVGEAAGTENYVYDANGNQLHRYLPNGMRTDQYYNSDNTLDSYYNWDSGTTIYSSYGYGYNADHQLTGASEGQSGNVHTAPNPTQTAYGYDGQGHLTGETRTGPSTPFAKSYIIDPAGNRQNMTEGALTTLLTYDNDDELKAASGGSSAYTYTYNANGDQIGSSINGQATTFGYDGDDQLTSMTSAAGSATYNYDALGRQVRRYVNGVGTTYYYDGSTPLYETTMTGTLTAQYTWGNGLVRRNGEYPLTDGRGSVRLTTDINRNVLSTNVREAFGRTMAAAGNTGSAYGYHGSEGYRSDGDGPLGGEAYQKVGARYYDAAFGRFLTRDTELSQKPYAYCNGDPVNHADPTGHTWRQFGGFALMWGGAALGLGGIFSSAATDGIGTFLGGGAAAAAGGAMIGKGWRMMHRD